MAIRYVVRLPAKRSRGVGVLEQRPWRTAGVALLLGVIAWTVLAGTTWLGAAIVRDLPTHDAVGALGRMARATTLHDLNGRVVFTLFREQRLEVPLQQVSPYFTRALLAVEDQRFYQHAGIDLVRLMGAAFVNFREGRFAQGGSTITQQLARQDLLTRERTVTRKLREMVVAARIERTYSKDQILELYLNKVYFGDGFYGVEAAARGFFGKPAAELDVAEAACLAGLIKSPSTYAPTVSAEKALARRAVVLQLMRDSGAIDEATYEAARHAPLRLHNGLRHEERFGLYFKEAVRQELVERFGWERVSEGGLRVYTTLDTAMQQSAEDILERSLAAVEARRGYRHTTRATFQEARAGAAEAAGSADYLQGALLALDPASGEVRALVGGRDFGDSPFNRVSQARRQPGSAFKPFVYAAAIEAGYTPATVLSHLDDPVLTEDGEWMPDDEHLDTAEITVRNALRTSSNRAAVRIIRDVGVAPTVEFVERLALGPVPAVPSLALGTGEVTLEAMTAAYAVFANGGQLWRPRLVRLVEDADGTVLWKAADEPRAAVAPTTAFLVASMLQDVVTSGTAAGARSLGFTLPAGGKTGTTNDYADAWFVGFTPGLVTGVWVGFDQPRTIVGRGYAADLAVPLWAQFMKVATAGDKPTWVNRPPGIVEAEVCILSGERPSFGCREHRVSTPDGGIEIASTIRTEYFIEGTEPVTMCRLHPGPGLLDRLAGAMTGDAHGAPVTISAPPVPRPFPTPAPSGTNAKSRDEGDRADHVEAQPKKRGFWSRIFGRGRDRERNQDDKAGEEKRKPDGRRP